MANVPQPSAKSASKDQPKPSAPADHGQGSAPAAPGQKKKHPRVLFTVGSKMIGLIAVLLMSSVATLVYLSTKMFIEDNTALIQQMNADTAANLATQTRELLESVNDKTRVLGTILLQEYSQKELKEHLVKEFFSKDKDLLAVFVYKTGASGAFEVAARATSPEMATLNDTDGSAALATLSTDKDFSMSLVGKGEVLITTLKLSDSSAAVALAVPFIQGQNGLFSHALVTVLRQTRFVKAFTESDIVTAFMVDRKGKLLAHPDAARVAAGENVAYLEVVKQLLSGKFNNGQTRYVDPSSKEARLGAFRVVGFGGLGVVAEVAEAKAFEAAKRVQYRAMLIGLLVLCIAFMTGYLYSGTITKPIKILMQASRRIAEGDFNINLKPKGRDEVAQLSIAMNEMALGLAERDKVKAAFNKFHSKEIAEKLMSGELNLGGERKSAAVFFSDVRGFTAMSEGMDPEALVKVLNRYMTRMVRVIISHGGVVDKYVGDAIMAVWGSPIAKEGDVERAIKACLGMRLSLAELNEELKADGLLPLKIGMGLNYGPLIAGNIGSEERMEYTVIGDTVNTASRIESMTKEFGTDLLISQDILKQVEGKFIVEKADEVKVKGKTEPLQVYKVHGYIDENGKEVRVQTEYSSYAAEKSDKVVHDDKGKKGGGHGGGEGHAAPSAPAAPCAPASSDPAAAASSPTPEPAAPAAPASDLLIETPTLSIIRPPLPEKKPGEKKKKGAA